MTAPAECPCCDWGHHLEACTCSGEACCHPERHSVPLPPTAFLVAVHARAERVAREATEGPWYANPYDWDADGFEASIGTQKAEIRVFGDSTVDIVGHGYEGGGVVRIEDAMHIVLHEPESVLQRVRAERVLLALPGLPPGVVEQLARAWGWRG